MKISPIPDCSAANATRRPSGEMSGDSGSSTIRRYASAGRIKAISVDAKKRPLYRIGDVLDVFLKRAA